MPKIPFAQSDSTIPASAGGVFAPMEDKVGEAITRSGAIFATSASWIADQVASDERYEWYLRKAQQDVDAVQLSNQVRSNADQAAADIKKLSTPAEVDDYVAKHKENQTGLYTDLGDPYIDNKVKKTISQQNRRVDAEAIRHKAALAVAKGKEEHKTLLQGYIRDYNEARTVEEQDAIFDAYSDDLRNIYQNDGIFNADEIKQFKDKFLGRAQKTLVIEAGATNPAAVYRMLLDKSQLTGIDPLERAKLIEHYAPKAQEQQVTEVYKTVLAEAGGDQLQAAKIMTNPKTLERFGIDAKIKDAVMNTLEHDYAVTKKQYDAFASDQIGKAFNKLHQNQKLTSDDFAGLGDKEQAVIRHAVDQRRRENHSVWLADQAHKRAVRMEAKMAAQEKSEAVAAPLQAKILSGDPSVDARAVYDQVAPDKLLYSDATKLVSMMGKVQKDPKYKPGVEILKDANKRGVFKAAGDYQRMLDDFVTFVDKEPGATPKRVIEIAESLVAPKKQGKVGEILDNLLNSFVNNYRSGIGLESVAPEYERPAIPVTMMTDENLRFTANKHGITVDELKRRLGVQ